MQCCVSFCCTAKWLSYAYMCLLFHILFHYGLSQDIEYSSLCYIVGPCLCIHFMYNSLHLLIPTSHFIPPLTPCPPWQLQVCSLCKDPWTFKAGTKLGALTLPFTLFYRQGKLAGTKLGSPDPPVHLVLQTRRASWDPAPAFQRRCCLGPEVTVPGDQSPVWTPHPETLSHWSCHPRQTLRAGRAGGKYVGLRNLNLIYFFFSVKRIKIQQIVDIQAVDNG